MAQWFTIATRSDIIFRSIRIALVVGTILVTINYADRIVELDIGSREILKIILTYCVPYCVSTYAAVSAILAQPKSDT